MHPYIFDGVEDPDADEFGEHMVEISGKFQFLDQLFKRTRKRKEQTLIFCQFNSTLDILEDYCTMRDLQFKRLDGSTPLDEREEDINAFIEPGSPFHVYLISTRAGGLGLNLMSANNVVIYDSDFNPQVDLQAMDRAHRIGQKKDVFVFRLVTMDSVEEKIIQVQTNKLKMDSLVVQGLMRKEDQEKEMKIDYDQVLLHGAMKILNQKQTYIQEIDIEEIIRKGVKNHKDIQLKKDQDAKKALDLKQQVIHQRDNIEDEEVREAKATLSKLMKEEEEKKALKLQESRLRQRKDYNENKIWAQQFGHDREKIKKFKITVIPQIKVFNCLEFVSDL